MIMLSTNLFLNFLIFTAFRFFYGCFDFPSTYIVLPSLSSYFVLIAMSYCSIPGCNSSNKSKNKHTLFKICRPELGKKTEEQRKHYQQLTNFLLKLRNTKGDNILQLLHKETATICERHFKETDIITSTSKKQLKLGSIPFLDLPKAKREIKV